MPKKDSLVFYANSQCRVQTLARPSFPVFKIRPSCTCLVLRILSISLLWMEGMVLPVELQVSLSARER